ncbi:putative Tetratricopeptide repeat (TPR)-like superfamily protein [Hibiscus syriacus]|uniref:Tetratricopeptide repeat (TPR)-like superfamily protein n=1 Tax=Hibiscus syriacus TaxID=106335 RepID=A0A6A2ZPS7_HIBSY|nr:putative Tetratricopeptide repeat (TPR)-like superfamily protein [Hibiscus syriacus]
MAISFFSHQWQSLQALFFILDYVLASYIRARPSYGDGADFWCLESSAPCSTYAAYFAQELDFLDLRNIANLFRTSLQEIARASNLVSEDTRLFPGQLLPVPITCGCTMNHYFANITYDIKLGDTYYTISTTVFESLTNFTAVEQMNPFLEPKNLHTGEEVVFPLFCKCPSKAESENGTEYFISYVWQPKDSIWSVSAMFNVSAPAIIDENKLNGYTDISSAVIPPLMIPVSDWSDVTRSEGFRPKIMQDKLLPGVSGYLGKPIMYDADVIMRATMNLNEHRRVVGSVYRATIDGKLLAIKKTKEDIAKELKISGRSSLSVAENP